MFDEIIDLLSKQVETLEKRGKSLAKIYEEAKEAKEIYDNKSITKNINKSRRYYPQAVEYMEAVYLFTSTMNKIGNKDFKSLELTRIKAFLNLCTNRSDEILEKIECISKIGNGQKSEVVNNIYNSMVADIFNELQKVNARLIETIPTAITGIYFNKYKDDYENGLQKIDANKAKIQELNAILATLKKDDKGYFESREDFEKFYNGWVKDNLDIQKQIELLHEINKINLTRKAEQKEEAISSEIEQNNEDVLKELDEQSRVKEIKTVDDIDEEEFEEKDREVVREFKRIYKEFDSSNVQRTETILDLESSEEDRLDCYMLDNCFQLGLILSDIDENVIPNIREEKDKVLEIMRLLPRIEKEKMTQEKTRELLIGKYKELISNLSNHDNVCNKMSESIREGRLDYILCMEHESMVNGYHIEDIELSYYVRDVISPIKELILEEQEKVYKNKYKRKVVSEDEITNLIDFIVDAEGIEKANEFVEQLKEYYPKADEFRINAEQTKEPYLMTLENKAKNYYLAHGDEYEVKSAYRKTYPYQEQLLLAIEDLPERVYNDPNACEEVSQTIVCFKDQKEIKDYDDITERPKKNSSSRPPLLSRNYDNVAKIFSHVTGNYRGNGRAIIFQFEPSEKVIEGLKEAYNLGSSFRVCLLVDGLSTAGANHDGYAPVVDRLIEGEYHDKIQNLANRLHDPNPNIPELISIIDFGLDLKDNIKSRLDSQKNRSDEESEMGAEGSSMQGNEGGVQR